MAIAVPLPTDDNATDPGRVNHPAGQVEVLTGGIYGLRCEGTVCPTLVNTPDAIDDGSRKLPTVELSLD